MAAANARLYCGFFQLQSGVHHWYVRALETKVDRKSRKGGCVMKRRVVGIALVFVVGVALLLAGCGAKVGATEQMLVDEPLGSAAVTEVRLAMGDGKLALSPGAAGLVSGTIDLQRGRSGSPRSLAATSD